ncbi:preprotein translocase subunit SecA [Helicobacter saguini]|uniref:Protein translocase subunit SecA n=1 Tax=Helicobacter saguini TaxID=1548018 RepID=A0A347VTT7_9HELI|nr:preprotein translocase subunit SecA [Helicobacter saguini]MWV67713.1 preprotein translocase subunit SecA [Helicobacter saguini]MWV70065.1 preprotein translocase subunit SecA [Helicobacter saguini]MWV72722.1 preprotein translocase subunit SecA [Helicobacter saguini]TLD92030.1 preprotein translocase subunit SecA [Helicobacter saguini]
MTAIMGKIFGTKNDKVLKQYRNRVARINAMEFDLEKKSDLDLQNRMNEIKDEIAKKMESLDSKELGLEILNTLLDNNLEEVFALTREASKRVLNMRHFDVQLIGGMALHDGKIAEMKTGEGKTLVATLPVILNALSGKSVHVVTVNDYLARRDSNTMAPLYNFFGFSVGVVTSGLQDDVERLNIYSNNIVYGTNNEYGFDYLRDNMKYNLEQKVQKHHFFAIIDEVDSILIDEARTPLIISGPVNKKMENYQIADSVAKALKSPQDFTIDEKNRVILTTEDGIKKAEKLFKVENLYAIENASLSHHLDQALKANYLFVKDKDYVVQNGEVVIVDEFTGRLSEGRRFSEGLHQALEAKEGVNIKEESQTLADITFQNYFRLYDKLGGMTGTAQTEATEFLEIYKLEVVSIPTNLPVARKDLNDLIYKSEIEKFNAVINKIVELHKIGQPVLVGTASIEKSEKLHELLKKARIPHNVLNAKQHEKEAEIIKNAGLKGAVTIATNMAGRGVDIKIDDEVKALGGLYIIGTERHESRRIDNQLRGRAGRQGDPGTSQFYLSLEDSLLRIFGSDRLKGIMGKLGLKDGESIESSMITKSVEKAQKKVESMHFESRKHLLEYDDVSNEQRKVIYRFRNELLQKDFEMQERIDENRILSVQSLLEKHDIMPHDVSENYNLESLCAGLKEEYLLELDSKALAGKTYDEISEVIIESLAAKYDEKFSHTDSKMRNELERIIYLQVVDNAWREHLYSIDHLKTGISLRGYNQKDPLVEYKKESYNLFLELIENIKIEAYRTLQIIQFASQDVSREEDKILNELESENENLVLNYANLEDEIADKKPARNDMCPCGSGKKYKNCHGKSGPKRGMLAKN